MKNSLLNLSDPFFSTRFLGFDSLFDSLRTFSEIGEDSRSYPPYNIKRDGNDITIEVAVAGLSDCLLYTSPSPRDRSLSRMPSSA